MLDSLIKSPSGAIWTPLIWDDGFLSRRKASRHRLGKYFGCQFTPAGLFYKMRRNCARTAPSIQQGETAMTSSLCRLAWLGSAGILFATLAACGGGGGDCLTLNVYAVNPPASSKQPVIVFIHGGGNVLGSAQDMPWGATPALAGHDVIVVTVENRLGLLGFLVNPLLTAESAQGSSGNYGLMDLIAALQWVRDNITEFGGDPARVMIDGHSAGSSDVEYLLASPGAPQWTPYDKSSRDILQLDDTIASMPGGYRIAQMKFLTTLPIRGF